ncbi:ABC transporter permease [Acidicapsa acidisoli]|uniref:ABC transporter permease n=1 Tax=Acidicapsa acidisoli TaxID=1615681 RepID=UPI0021DFF884|nr:FtsX-like permease family protein [Acidicapsa acidisoli]
MWKFLLLAFRNIFRNRRRTVMTLVMVGGGVAGLLLVGGFFARMFWGLRESTINDGLGHIQIFTAEHFDREEKHVLDTGIDNWRQVAASVSTGGHVRGVAPRIEFYGMLSNGVKSGVFMGSAVDPVAEKSLGFTPRLAVGRDLDARPGGEVEALIGTGVARSMNVKPGDGLTLLAVTSDGALNGIDVQIVGTVNTGYKEVDDRYLRITLPSAQRLLQSDRVTNLVVGLDATENTDKVASALAPRLNGSPQHLVLKKWIDLAAYYKQVRSLFSTIFVFLGVIVFFMVLMSSVNTLLMSMFERTREIGTMLAMGTPRSWIMALFMLEATLLGVLGAIVGVVGGNLLGVLLNHSGIHLPPPPGTTAPMSFRVLHVPSLMIASSLLVILSLALASILPAIRASRLQIAEALAHV